MTKRKGESLPTIMFLPGELSSFLGCIFAWICRVGDFFFGFYQGKSPLNSPPFGSEDFLLHFFHPHRGESQIQFQMDATGETTGFPCNNLAGQIIATSHDRFPQKGSFLEGKSSISGKSRLVKYYNLARKIVFQPSFSSRPSKTRKTC